MVFSSQRRSFYPNGGGQVQHGREQRTVPVQRSVNPLLPSCGARSASRAGSSRRSRSSKRDSVGIVVYSNPGLQVQQIFVQRAVAVHVSV
jgi:hypothetical protein